MGKQLNHAHPAQPVDRMTPTSRGTGTNLWVCCKRNCWWPVIPRDGIRCQPEVLQIQVDRGTRNSLGNLRNADGKTKTKRRNKEVPIEGIRNHQCKVRAAQSSERTAQSSERTAKIRDLREVQVVGRRKDAFAEQKTRRGGGTMEESRSDATLSARELPAEVARYAGDNGRKLCESTGGTVHGALRKGDRVKCPPRGIHG